MIRPSRARYLLEAQPQPLSLSIPAPGIDTFELYRRISPTSQPSFLLESAHGHERTARYSFMGSDPYLLLTGKGDRCELRRRDGVVLQERNPFAALVKLMRASRMPQPEDLPPFFGGAVGFLSYDTVRTFEPLPHRSVDDLRTPDLQFMFVDLLAAIDHQTGTLHLIFTPPLERVLGEPREKLYREGCERLGELEARLSVRRPSSSDWELSPSLDAHPDQSRSSYIHRVLECQDYIRAGDIYQANLSHRFTIDVASSVGPSPVTQASRRHLARSLYHQLRRVNPSPFAALVECDGLCLVSSSPERLVRLHSGEVQTRPIAGTRPRGRDVPEDRRLAEELLKNHKERAEHIMLLDLERNDLGRVCRCGTVQVDEFMVIERYSHVSHIVSNVAGSLRYGLDAFDLIPAMFPGGTITGVPKIRCMEILETLEPVRRGPYTGSLGYLSWSGDLDLNIIIRTIVLTGTHGYLQVGAGIVADSDPSREYDETLLKAEALIEALRANVKR